MIQVIYPGTFDPITNGHIDIIKKASKIFDYIILAISSSINKKIFFSTNERVSLVKKVTKKIHNIKVISFNGLITDFAKTNKINVMIRGLRNFSDFNKEINLANMNKKLFYNLETIFILSDIKNSFISSSLIKEIFLYKGNFQKFVPKIVYNAIKKKLY